MSVISFIAVVSVSTLLLASSTKAIAGNGATLYKAKACQTCHGPDGKTPLLPAYPKIAGQNAEYLIQQITDIRDGQRSNGLSAAMKPMTSNLRDPEIKAIANWLASQ